MKTISILSAAPGWMVRAEGLDGEQFFRLGSSAEAAAIRLAQGFADAGEDADVAVYIRDGSLAKRFAVPALRAAQGGAVQPSMAI